MNVYAYYTPGRMEELRVWERLCRNKGDRPRVLTVRSVPPKLLKKFTGPLSLLALHGAGGGWLVSFQSRGNVIEKWTKKKIEARCSRRLQNVN